MIELNISSEQLAFAEKLAEDRERVAKGKGLFDRNWKNSRIGSGLLGAIGEVVFADYFFLPRPSHIDGKDSGSDFVVNGKLVDVKCSSYSKDRVDLILYEGDLVKVCDGYCLVCVDEFKGVAWIVGFIDKENFRLKCERRDFGYGVRLCVGVCDLRSVF